VNKKVPSPLQKEGESVAINGSINGSTGKVDVMLEAAKKATLGCALNSSVWRGVYLDRHLRVLAKIRESLGALMG
jgi:hypothetical protein